MTDKEIKDYCKNCDVEPPAMKFKCPECEHNPNNENNFAKDINVPHKEQIMIDGQFKVSPSAKLVLLYLADCYNPKTAKMFPKQKTIAAKLGISERSVIRAISELREGGFILVESNLSNRYVFGAKMGLCDLSDNKNFSSEEMSPQDEKISSQNDKMSSSYIEQKKETNKSTNIEDYKILKAYAVSKGAININAYINALVKSGSAKEIIKNEKQKMANIKAMEANTAKVIKDLEFAKANAANVDSSFFENIRLRMQIKQ